MNYTVRAKTSPNGLVRLFVSKLGKFFPFLDGYFLCQLSASYGNLSAPPGQKISHMIDAIGAVGSFHISNGQVRHFGIFSSIFQFKGRLLRPILPSSTLQDLGVLRQEHEQGERTLGWVVRLQHHCDVQVGAGRIYPRTSQANFLRLGPIKPRLRSIPSQSRFLAGRQSYHRWYWGTLLGRIRIRRMGSRCVQNYTNLRS